MVRATGKSLAFWQREKVTPPLPDAQIALYALRPERASLYARINTRFEQMMTAGALHEVRKFLAEYGGSDAPIGKACGVPELAAHLRGELSLEAAIALAKQHSRNYAKRQMTWIANQCAGAADAALLLG